MDERIAILKAHNERMLDLLRQVSSELRVSFSVTVGTEDSINELIAEMEGGE